MPVNPEATFFQRIQRWSDALLPGQPWTRVQADAFLDDLATGINAAYQSARVKKIPFAALPPFGNAFERLVTANLDGSVSLREWQGSAWVELATITAAGLLTRGQEFVSYADVIVGDGDTVAVVALAADNPANGRVFDITITNATGTTYFAGQVIRPAAGGAGVVIEHGKAHAALAFNGGALEFTPTANGADNFHVLVRRSL